MRLRTIKQAADFLKEQDPGCALTPTAIRRKIISGEIPCVMAGNKYLLDIDTLERRLFTPGNAQNKNVPATMGDHHARV